ncbi:MAG: signal peptidase I [Epulopiscium sp.]|nr:signal peptidase I [Candidatus Epulonipiscium sp.]
MKKIWQDFKYEIFAIMIGIILMNITGISVVLGSSMNPTLINHDIVLMDKISVKTNHIEHGDIVVLKSQFKTKIGTSKRFVKRVIGISGDKITIIKGNVYLNDNIMEESYINGDYTFGDMEVIVPNNKFFVMGDNRGDSLDSRDASVGFVDISDIEAVVPFRLYPFDHFGKVD